MEVLQGFFMTFALLLIVCILSFYYLKKQAKYWKNLGLSTSWNLADICYGIIASTVKTPCDLDLIFYEKYGRIYGGFLITQPLLFIADPEILKKIFVKDFQYFPTRRIMQSGDNMVDTRMTNAVGEDWKRIRSIASPAFSSGKLKKMASLIEECAKNLSDNVYQVSLKTPVVDMKRFCGTYTMDVIATVAFGTKITDVRDPNNPFVFHARKLFSRDFSLRIMISLMIPELTNVLKVGFAPETTAFFKQVAKKLMQTREDELKSKPNDFLQILMDSLKNHNQEFSNSTEKIEEIFKIQNGLENFHGNRTMSKEELVAQCVLFFTTAYDATSNSVSLAAMLLAQNLDIQEKLILEVDEIFEKHEVLDFDVISKMQYLECVVNETLRLYPSGSRLERRCAEDYECPELGITIPKGTIVAVPVYAMHRDPEWYTEPLKFMPERFLPENKPNNSPYVYLPFGAGPRNCIALRMALFEVKMGLAYLVRNFRFHLAQETKVPPQFFNGTFLLSCRNVMLKVEHRWHHNKT